jgi:hypothetical protein
MALWVVLGWACKAIVTAIKNNANTTTQLATSVTPVSSLGLFVF